MTHNPNCDGGGYCWAATSEVRALPIGDDGTHGNAILCRSCFQHEIQYRKERNKELEPSVQFDLPSWDKLAIYEYGPE